MAFKENVGFKIPDVSGGVEELYALSGDSDSDDENLPEGVEFDDDDEQTVIRYIF